MPVKTGILFSSVASAPERVLAPDSCLRTPIFRRSLAQSANAEIVDPFHWRAAVAADQGVAISAHQRLRDRFGARRTIEIGARLGFGHPGYYATENIYEKNPY
jgi:hypothetical protein